jgi:hypothetical protein
MGVSFQLSIKLETCKPRCRAVVVLIIDPGVEYAGGTGGVVLVNGLRGARRGQDGQLLGVRGDEHRA